VSQIYLAKKRAGWKYKVTRPTYPTVVESCRRAIYDFLIENGIKNNGNAVILALEEKKSQRTTTSTEIKLDTLTDLLDYQDQEILLKFIYNSFTVTYNGQDQGSFNQLKTFGDNQEYQLSIRLFKYFKPEEKRLASVPLGYSVASFSGVCFLAHATLIASTYLLPEDHTFNYKNMIFVRKINYLRWAEYFISSGIMVVNVAAVCRISDMYTLSNIFMGTAITNVFGLWTEMAGKRFKLVPFWLGFIPFMLPWIQILDKFFTDSDYFEDNIIPLIKEKSGKDLSQYSIPLFIKIAAVGLFGIYFAFPANMFVQYWVYQGEDAYARGERNYLILSAISKSFLSWCIFGAAFSSNREYGENLNEEE
jgi:hypothetical protein